jgi:NADPH-dependent ferric siderophore reductase
MNTPAPAAKPRKPRYPATVKRVVRLTPRLVRITFTSPELGSFGWNGPAAHIKLIFPTAQMRTYTPRRFDAAARELDVDFVLHGEGPASAWASQAAVGQSLTVAGPGRHYVIDPRVDWFVLAGDDTAIPAISTILEHLPPTALATVLLEVVDASEEHEIHSTGKASITWLHRGEDPARAGALLEESIRALELPAGAGRVYVACEAAAMRRIRRHLLTERSLERDHVVTRGYWKLGETDHPDGDYGQDV